MALFQNAVIKKYLQAQNKEQLKEGKLYNAILDQEANPPLFNTVHDTINGLRIVYYRCSNF